MRVLFLCTSKYFRGHFSQALFQQLIEINQATGVLQVDPAQLKVDTSSGNLGPMAPEAISALQDRGISIDPASLAAPKQLTKADLDAADVVVAVDEAAHRPMVQQLFPSWKARSASERSKTSVRRTASIRSLSSSTGCSSCSMN